MPVIGPKDRTTLSLPEEGDAEEVRADQGQPEEAGEVLSGSETDSGGDVQQATEEGSEASDPEEALDGEAQTPVQEPAGNDSPEQS